MKYSDNSPPIVCMQKNSTCYKNTSKMTIRGVLWHSTGANNPTLKRYVQPYETDANYNDMIQLIGKNTGRNDWNHVSVQAGLNAWIGKLADGTVAAVQTMPWNYKPWGCGGGCNNGWIQFEICEDGLNDPSYFEKIYKEACELTAYLCKKYGLNPNGTVSYSGKKIPVILCHADSYQLGMGSNHVDVLHWFRKFGKSMETVRNDVASLMNGIVTETNSTEVNYQVKVTANDGLNCRKYPINGSIVMTYKKGTILAITKEQDGWGYTGAGWVSLEWTEKIASTTVTEEDEDMTLETFKKLMNEYRKELRDNDCGTWSKEAREWAVANGIFVGGDPLPDGSPNYMWEDMLTREQAAQLFYNFSKKHGLA